MKTTRMLSILLTAPRIRCDRRRRGNQSGMEKMKVPRRGVGRNDGHGDMNKRSKFPTRWCPADVADGADDADIHTRWSRCTTRGSRIMMIALLLRGKSAPG